MHKDETNTEKVKSQRKCLELKTWTSYHIQAPTPLVTQDPRAIPRAAHRCPLFYRHVGTHKP